MGNFSPEALAALVEQAKKLTPGLVTQTGTPVGIPDITVPIIQPDVNGEFPTPLDGALWMASKDIPQTPLLAGTKKAFLSAWQESATTDPVKLRAWAAQHRGCNFGSVAKPGQTFVFEADSPEVRARFDAIRGQFSSQLVIESSPGKGHRYYLSVPGIENISQTYTKHGDFSIRADDAYTVSPGSIHPTTGKQYRVASNGALAKPNAAEIAFWQSEKLEKKSSNINTDLPRDSNNKVPHGSVHGFLVKLAGKLRGFGLTPGEIEPILIRKAHDECAPPIDEGRVRQIARSMENYKEGSLTGGELLMSSLETAQPQPIDWRACFKSVGELEQGEVRMLIDRVLPEGTTFIGGLPGEGKTLFALSIAKALTTGEPFLGNFDVPEVVPVIYLIPESGGRAFRKRCEKFHIPDNPELFLCRTVSEGATLPLDDSSLFEAVRRLRPVVILDTLIRFSEAEDENAAMQNKALVDDIIKLRQAGASGVIGLHHAAKVMREKGMSLETALRGTGDIAACADAVYGLLRDSALYNNGAGPNEIDVACLKPRDFEPPAPFRIAASQKYTGEDMSIGSAPGIVSVIDRYWDFLMVNKEDGEIAASDTLERLVKEDPAITLDELSKITGQSTWTIRQSLKKRNWFKTRGGNKGASRWTFNPLTGVENAGAKPDTGRGSQPGR